MHFQTCGHILSEFKHPNFLMFLLFFMRIVYHTVIEKCPQGICEVYTVCSQNSVLNHELQISAIIIVFEKIIQSCLIC